MNVELLQKVKAHILEKPERFVMTRWQVYGLPGEEIVMCTDEMQKIRKVPECGTMACIAGWTVALTDPTKDHQGVRSISEYATDLLGLNEAPDMFWLQKWSRHFRATWKATRSPRKHAQIAARVIDQFIKKHAKN
jgi:hypothetical protein